MGILWAHTGTIVCMVFEMQMSKHAMMTNGAAICLMLIVKCCEHADLGDAQDMLKQ